MTENDSEFPVGLSFQGRSSDLEKWLLNSARQLSIALACNSLYTGSPLQGASPYHSIVFASGLAFLASDLGTKLAKDGEAAVKLLHRVPELDAENV